MKIQYKLAFVIFIFGSVFLTAISTFFYFQSRGTILNEVKNSLLTISEDTAYDLSSRLIEKSKTTLTLSNVPFIIDALIESNAEYASLADAERAEKISALNNQWRETDDLDDPFIKERMSNAVAEYLLTQQSILPGEYGEIFITNRYGVMIASTKKLTTLAHSHKYWWQAGYYNGQGRVFFDDRGFDGSVGGYVFGIVVPVKKDDEIVGMLKCNLNMFGSLNHIISEHNIPLGTRLKIVRSGGVIVLEEGQEPLSTKVPQKIVEKLKEGRCSSTLLSVNGNKKLYFYAPVLLTRGSDQYGFGGTYKSIDHIQGNIGEIWFIVIVEDFINVLASLQTSINWIGIIGILCIILMACIALLLGRRIARPIVGIAQTAAKIGTGDFSVRTDVASKDEIGALGNSINRMVSDLDQTTTSRDKLLEEMDQRKKAEEKREKTLQELREALDNIKTLKGLLPICASCKKIRDDKGYWNKIEGYIKEHSEAEFTHSICPECAKKLYPELYKDK